VEVQVVQQAEALGDQLVVVQVDLEPVVEVLEEALRDQLFKLEQPTIAD
jgi:hypothetical protein